MEIVRWLSVRGETRVEEGYEAGRLMALAFNAPKVLAQEVREYLRGKRLAAVSSKGGLDGVVEMFRSVGVPVIDSTKEG